MTIALVSGQAVTGGNTSASSFTLALAANPTAGNFVVVGWTFISNSDTTTPTISVKDGAATPNTYAATSKTPFNGGSAVGLPAWAGIHYLQGVPSGANKSITITQTGNTTPHRLELCIMEFSGVATSGAFEQDATNVANTASPITSPSLTTTSNGDLLYAMAVTANNISTAGAPWTLVGSDTPGGNNAEYFIQSSAGAQAVNFTFAAGTGQVCIEAAFIAAGLTLTATSLLDGAPILGTPTLTVSGGAALFQVGGSGVIDLFPVYDVVYTYAALVHRTG